MRPDGSTVEPRAAAALALALLLALLGAPGAFAQASTELHSGRIVSTYLKDVTHFGMTEPVFFFRIHPDDPFEFALPLSMIQRPNQDLHSLGMALWWWKAPTGRLPFAMPNKVLVIRATLLAAKAYFDRVAAQRGAPFVWPTAADPLPVQLGHFPSRDAAAYVRLTDTPVVMRFRVEVSGVSAGDTPADTAARAVHEYFHVVQRLLWPGDPDGLAAFFESDPVLMELLLDATAEWATDEPIRTGGAGPYGPIDLDAVNRYRDQRGNYFLRNRESLLGRDRYESGFLVKYLAEQAAGGRDAPQPEAVFDLFQRVYAENRLDRDIVLRTLSELLAPGRFPGASWQERWQRFFAAFNAAHIVQNGSPRHDPADRIAFLDDAFTTADDAQMFHLEGPPYGGFTFEKEQSVEDLTAIHREPAASDEERIRRMQPLLQRTEMAPLSGLYHLLRLSEGNREYLGSRPVFIYAEGDPGTDVLLLEQSLPDGSTNYFARAGARFHWRQDFSLLDASDPTRPAQLLRHEIPASPGTDVAFAFAALNSAPDDTARFMRWGYIASPRLIPVEGGGSRGSDTVEEPNSPAGRNSSEGYYNGDEFSFQVRVAGKVHLGSDDRADIPPEERTLESDLRCGETGASVKLDESGGPGSASPRGSTLLTEAPGAAPSTTRLRGGSTRTIRSRASATSASS